MTEQEKIISMVAGGLDEATRLEIAAKIAQQNRSSANAAADGQRAPHWHRFVAGENGGRTETRLEYRQPVSHGRTRQDDAKFSDIECIKSNAQVLGVGGGEADTVALRAI